MPVKKLLLVTVSYLGQQDNEHSWLPGEVVDKSNTPRSYLVRDIFGKVYRRNSSFIRTCPNAIPERQSDPLIEYAPNE